MVSMMSNSGLNASEPENSANKANIFPAEIGYPVLVQFIELAKLYMNTVPWQWHEELEILIVNHGDIRFMINDEQKTIHAGEGVVINSNVMHSICPATDNINCSMYSTAFHPSFLFGYQDVSLAEKYLIPITGNKSFQYLFLNEEDPISLSILTHINEIIAHNMLKSPGFELKVKSELCLFWTDLLSIITPKENVRKIQKSTSVDETRTKEMILYMEENYSDKITLDELAEHVHISKSECCRCFKRVLNVTPVEYLMKYRIYTAARMIQREDPVTRSFSDLAYQVGFNNASYFNKVFREYLGCTPSEYKKKAQTVPGFDPFMNISI